ncbi:MAG TPA: NAD-dependent protein deacetylase [Gammaproteobacteria bacterium]|nr:NAD-dependent protein deacetylase [Gammaproteobacteria bacterium]
MPGPGTSRAGPAVPDALLSFVTRSRRLLVLTGAGCSTESGIPDYRDADGAWKHSAPVMYQDFLASPATRRRYWARSLIGWRRIAAARPNPAHVALARMEQAGIVHHVVTQNVDGLHDRAGSRKVIDLHGRLDTVVCLGCGERSSRAVLQAALEARNRVRAGAACARPDGDADAGAGSCEDFDVPCCERCAGVLKPDVVFFGEPVPRERTASAFARLSEADALLVAGSSLMVFSGYRLARAAAERGLPLAIVNLGRTRADSLAPLRIEGRCGELLDALARRLQNVPARPAAGGAKSSSMAAAGT